jgi:hypothetical protein
VLFVGSGWSLKAPPTGSLAAGFWEGTWSQVPFPSFVELSG